MLFSACTKEETAKISPKQQNTTESGVYVKDGILTFATEQDFSQTLDSWLQMDENQLIAETQRLGHESYLEFSRYAMAEIAEAESEEKIDALLQIHSKYIVVEDEMINYRIWDIVYGALANADGIYRIGKTYHQISEAYILQATDLKALAHQQKLLKSGKINEITGFQYKSVEETNLKGASTNCYSSSSEHSLAISGRKIISRIYITRFDDQTQYINKIRLQLRAYKFSFRKWRLYETDYFWWKDLYTRTEIKTWNISTQQWEANTYTMYQTGGETTDKTDVYNSYYDIYNGIQVKHNNYAPFPTSIEQAVTSTNDDIKGFARHYCPK